MPLASEPGGDYARTGDRALTYYSGLGADVAVAPDARRAPDEAAAVVRAATTVVLTGGSPRRLRDALVASGLAEVVRDRHAAGAMVVGSSAGAMVACTTTLLPAWRGNPDAGPGLGLVDGYVVVPHFDGKRGGWVKVALSMAPAVLGVPECSGVLVDGDRLTSLGVSAATLITAEGRRSVAGVGFEPT